MSEQEQWPRIGMTIEEAAESLRVAPNTVRMLIKDGELPARKVGKGWRIDPDAVRIWLANGQGKEQG